MSATNMSVLVGQQPIRNDFSFLGLTEQYLAENPDYITVFDFEKHDYLPYYWVLHKYMWPVFAVAGVYLFGILGLQRWMKNREPYDLRKPLFAWNVMLAGLSMIMFSRFLPELIYINQKYGFYRTYCKLDHFNAATVFWIAVYTASKILEFIDTVFIVLRKQKLTFLHTFHHTSVYVACIYGLIRADPAARYFAFMNTFVHSVMYSYYALRAAQFKLPRKLAMAVTAIQVIQFATAFVINGLVGYAKVMGSEPHCERPNDISLYYTALGTFYLYLFGNFFVQTYMKKRAINKAKAQ